MKLQPRTKNKHTRQLLTLAQTTANVTKAWFLNFYAYPAGNR